MRKLRGKRKGLLSQGYLWIVMAIFLFFIRFWVKGSPDLLEKIYPLALNQKITGFLSQVTGIVPISLGELFVYLNLILALVFVIFLGVKIFQGGVGRHIYRGITYVSLLFVIFMVVFGFNYERVSVREAFKLVRTNYGVEELYQLNEALITQANALRQQVTEDGKGVFSLEDSNQAVFLSSQEAFVKLQEDYPKFKGTYGQAKPILASELLNYTGITGIFMPFTGEANVNTKGPDLFFPSTILHEMAHQRGVAYEGEANYVSYVASLYHEDPVFKYSGTMLGLIKTMNAMYGEDIERYRELRSRYSEGLNRDLKAYGEFYKQYEGPVNEQATKVNDTYLKSNGQAQGVKSYNEMVDLLLEQFIQKGKL
ncbi:MAG: DUF3810 domain-containing protein [Clostridium sp.]|jgi:hypothetical protein|nr:DUF3810 domain-containing protein [Clostridium sp.]